MAQLFLIITFPFWFPRMLFWMMVEFFRVQMSEWLPETPKNEDTAEGLALPEGSEAPLLVLIPGFKSDDAAFLFKPRRRRQNTNLRLIAGGNWRYSKPSTAQKKAL